MTDCNALRRSSAGLQTQTPHAHLHGSSIQLRCYTVATALHVNPPQSYGASPAIWDYTVLPATRHRWAHPALTPAMQAGTWFTYPGGMEGWVDLGVGYITR